MTIETEKVRFASFQFSSVNKQIIGFGLFAIFYR